MMVVCGSMFLFRIHRRCRPRLHPRPKPHRLGEAIDSVCHTTGVEIRTFIADVLSVGKALPIQAHPDKEIAEILNKTHYKDSNHKPEMAVAITEFKALCGFVSIEGKCHTEQSGFEGAWTSKPLIFDNSYYDFIRGPREKLTALAFVFNNKFKEGPLLSVFSLQQVE